MKKKLFLLPVSLLLLNPAFADQKVAPANAAVHQEKEVVEASQAEAQPVSNEASNDEEVAAKYTPEAGQQSGYQGGRGGKVNAKDTGGKSTGTSTNPKGNTKNPKGNNQKQQVPSGPTRTMP